MEKSSTVFDLSTWHGLNADYIDRMFMISNSSLEDIMWDYFYCEVSLSKRSNIKRQISNIHSIP